MLGVNTQHLFDIAAKPINIFSNLLSCPASLFLFKFTQNVIINLFVADIQCRIMACIWNNFGYGPFMVIENGTFNRSYTTSYWSAIWIYH